MLFLVSVGVFVSPLRRLKLLSLLFVQQVVMIVCLLPTLEKMSAHCLSLKKIMLMDTLPTSL